MSLLLILLFGAALRLAMLRYPIVNGLPYFEPDVFIYSYVSASLLHNGFMLPSITLSGVPPNPYPEGLPLVYLPAILAWLSGQSVYSVIPWLAPAFSLLGVILAYLLTFELSKNSYASLFAAFIYAVMPAALSRGMAGMWRGEVAVPILFGFGILFLLKWWRNSRQALHGIATMIFLFLALIWWNGSLYIIGSLFLLASSFFVFFLLRLRSHPTGFSRSSSSETNKGASAASANKWAHIAMLVTIMGALPVAYSQEIVAKNVITLAIQELTPATPSTILLYFGWVFFAAMAGVFISIYYSRSEHFDITHYALLSMFIPAFGLSLLAIRWMALFALPAAVYGAYGIYAMLKMFKVKAVYAYFIIILCIMILAYLGINFSVATAPADALNGNFITAAAWLASNTPQNSLILTLWPDGSVVEAIGQRQSYSDSIMGGTGMPGFGRFLFARAGNYTFLNQSLDRSRPNYLFVRSYWTTIQASIALEAGLAPNMSINGTNMQQLINGTAPFRKAYVGPDASNGSIIIYNMG